MADFQKNTNSALAWLALILAVAALGLAWMAYDRAGVDLSEQIENEVRSGTAEVIEQAQEATMRANDAAERLEQEVQSEGNTTNQ